MNATSNPSVVIPVLFHDFNMPVDSDGLYSCLAHAFLPAEIGDKVRFGCEPDDVMANGTVVGFYAAGRLVKVRLDSWVPDALSSEDATRPTPEPQSSEGGGNRGRLSSAKAAAAPDPEKRDTTRPTGDKE